MKDPTQRTKPIDYNRYQYNLAVYVSSGSSHGAAFDRPWVLVA